MKKTNVSPFVVLLLALLVQAGLYGQEVLRPLKTNPVLTGHAAKAKGALHANSSRITSHGTDTICLPFLDDFSNPVSVIATAGPTCTDIVYRDNAAIYPSNLYWTDSGAFVNTTYPVGPPTYGVATLDGLDKFGQPYSESAPYGPADTLTSKPINLSGALTDSLYLSFFVQGGGLGNSPDSNDSLLLEFKKDDGSWVRVWSLLDTTTQLDSFKIVMVPVADPAYRHGGFQFRYRNYATRNGNNDHWHIDFVYLDENRTVDDILFRDIAFTQAPKSILKSYEQMPWGQLRDFQSAELRTTQSVQVRNNFNIDNNTSFVDTLTEAYSSTLITAGVAVSFPVLAGFYHSFDHNVIEIPSTAPNYNEDSFSVQQNYVITPSGDFNNANDTIRRKQSFYNYYAYDDGTAEAAYGLIGTGARLALRYETNVADSIHAVYMHWAYNSGSNSGLFFSLLVWDEIDTTGGSAAENLLYQDNFNTPTYIDSVNGFYVYELSEPIPVDGIFYVGWLQSQTDLLNIGFDRNTDTRRNTFYDLGNGFVKSTLEGSLMIRPQLGPKYSKYDLPPFVAGIANEVAPSSFDVFPNPTTDQLFPQLPESNYNYTVVDMTGRTVAAGAYTGHAISTIDLQAGLYLLRMEDQNGQLYQTRFLRLEN